jgi:F-type H+-transporting ATPase subunit gamma
MANRRVLVKRRKATRNIRKITRTMQLVATARFQAAFNRLTASKPYTEKLAEVVADLSRALQGAGGDVQHPLLAEAASDKPGVVVVITSNRGLAGAYNSNILRAAIQTLDEAAAAGHRPEAIVSGGKGTAFFRFAKRPASPPPVAVSDTPRFEQVEPLANALMNRFLRGEISSVKVVYMRFLSAGQQRADVMQLLPLATPAAVSSGPAEKSLQYEFLPDAKSLLEELLPATVRVRLFQAFTDAAVSEQVARMVAMKAATDAAEEMIKQLSRDYNRARQTAITMELLDIVGGANALA